MSNVEAAVLAGEVGVLTQVLGIIDDIAARAIDNGQVQTAVLAHRIREHVIELRAPLLKGLREATTHDQM